MLVSRFSLLENNLVSLSLAFRTKKMRFHVFLLLLVCAVAGITSNQTTTTTTRTPQPPTITTKATKNFYHTSKKFKANFIFSIIHTLIAQL